MITKPGFYKLSNEEYHKDPALNKSGLVELARSPRHFKAMKEEPKETTPAMVFGSAFHLAVLEPDEYKKKIVIAPSVPKRSKADKATWAAFNDRVQKGGLIPISQEDADTIEHMKKAVLENETAAALLSDGIAELSGFFRDQTGVMCKIRTDWITGDRIVVDLKSCRDASFSAFQRDSANLKYHWQAAFYLDGLTTLTGEEHVDFLFLCVEKTVPYGVAVYRLDHEAIEAGRRQIRPLINQYAECLARDYWPGYVDTVQQLGLPRWAL